MVMPASLPAPAAGRNLISPRPPSRRPAPFPCRHSRFILPDFGQEVVGSIDDWQNSDVYE
jgi:hypothetical protein